MPRALARRQEAVLAGADPLAADLDDLAAADRVVQRAAADAVARLQHGHRVARVDEVAAAAQPGQAGADHDHVARRAAAAVRFPRVLAAAEAASVARAAAAAPTIA